MSWDRLNEWKRKHPILRRKLERTWVSRNHEKSIEKSKRWKKKNKQRLNQWRKEYWKLHPRRLKAMRKRYYLKHRTEIWRKQKLYKQKPERRLADNASKAKWSLKHPRKRKVANKKWSHGHPDNALATKHARRARIAGNGGRFTPSEWRTLLKKYNHSCAKCGSKNNLEADHIIPIKHGGTSFITNIQPLCRRCNRKKSSKIS